MTTTTETGAGGATGGAAQQTAANTTAAQGGQGQQATNQGAGQGQAGQGDQGQGQQPGPVPYDRFKTVNDELGQLKQRLAQIDQAEAQRKREADEAEQKRLADQQQFKELADRQTAKVTELEPYKGKAERYEGALGKLLEEQLKGVPEWVKPLLEKLDAVEKLEWLAQNAGQFQGQGQRQTPLNINATAIGAAGGATAAKQEEQVELWRRLGLNNAVRAAQSNK